MDRRFRIFWIIAAAVMALDLGYVLVTLPPGGGPAQGADAPRASASRTPSPGLAGEPITIGAILPLTGDHADIGAAMRQALDLAVETIDAEHGFGGHPVTVETRDGGCTRDGGTTAARALIEKGVSAIIGGACSEETLGAAAALAGKDILLIAPSGSAAAVSAAGTWVFRLVPSDARTAAAERTYRKDHPGRSLRPYFDERTTSASAFFKGYRERWSEDPLPPWYLANAYSALFLLRDLSEDLGNKPMTWQHALASLAHWSGGALDDLSFDGNGDAVWTRFVASETKDGATTDIEAISVGE